MRNEYNDDDDDYENDDDYYYNNKQGYYGYDSKINRLKADYHRKNLNYPTDRNKFN